MTGNRTLKQPYLGIVSTGICIAVSLAICAVFDAATFGTWVTLILVAMVPAQIVLGLVWEAKFPKLVTRLPQPMKGLTLLALMAMAGLVVAPATIFLVGGGIMPPTPYTTMFIIFSVVMTFWLVTVMQCWPLTAISKSTGFVGIGVWFLTYVLTYVLFSVFFDYGFFKGTPLYIEALDPKGLFNAWYSLSFAITALVMMLALVLLDFWPIGVITKRVDMLGRQPFFGILSTLFVLILSYCLWYFFVIGRGMDPVVYMVRVPVSIVFGQFIMLTMLKTAPFQTLVQPLKGSVLLILSAILSVVMYEFYWWASGLILGSLPAGAPGYELDLWLASAMLAVTFPVFVTYAEFLGYWPLINLSGEEAIDELA
ncbi:MAG: hypothetical protein O6945_08480 [Gammaproteobacteria bacterium]|nr:hypothetical protein [Gammaproteobacteria bacterium]